jgi:hypothetical protein
MIIPSSTHGVIASSRPRVVVAGGGGDVTPNAVNFISVYYNNDFIEYGYTEKQITGINQTITLKVQYNSPGSTVYYSVSNSSGFAVFGDNNSPNSPISYGMTAISNNGTFTVSNNQYVTFGVTPVCSVSAMVTVLNQSDGDAVLDTFFIEHYGEC